MRKRTPTPVPPLGDAALSRIERGLFAALDARPLEPERVGRRRGRAFAVSSVVSFVGVAAAVALFAVREARRGETLPARAAQISTTTSGTRISIAGATLDVAPQSAISFGGGRDGAVVVVLDRGTVTCEVAPRAKRAPFIVEAGVTRVTVIGTRFSVHRVGEHATVSVDHGLVEVADTNMTELVHAGERFRPGEPVTREPLASEAPGPASTLPSTPPAGLPGPPVLAAGATTPHSALPIVASPAPVSAARAAGSARHPRRLALAETAPQPHSDEAPVDPSAPAARAEIGAPAPAVAAAAEKPQDAARGTQRRSVQVLFELAAQLEVRDPEAALRIYGELAAGQDEQDTQGKQDGQNGKGSWAASALFAAARLEAERGHAPRARELCETYLQRFPMGPNAGDARTMLAPAP